VLGEQLLVEDCVADLRRDGVLHCDARIDGLAGRWLTLSPAERSCLAVNA